MFKSLVVLASFFVFSAAQAGDMMEVKVKGMVCAFCAQGIEKKFKEQEAVQSIDVNLKEKTVKIFWKKDQRLSKDKVSELLKDAGYEAVFQEGT